METVYSKILATIEKRGWYQGGNGLGADGSLCLMHALRQHTAKKDISLDMEACTRISNYIYRRYRTVYSQIHSWNDDPKTTFADVKGMLIYLHNQKLIELGEKAMEIGEPLKEVEFEPTRRGEPHLDPMTEPAAPVPPVVEPTVEPPPVEEPEKVPA